MICDAGLVALCAVRFRARVLSPSGDRKKERER